MEFARLRLEAIAAALLMPDGSAVEWPPVGVNGNSTSSAPHGAPSPQGEGKENQLKAFPFRGRWQHPLMLTDEVLFPHTPTGGHSTADPSGIKSAAAIASRRSLANSNFPPYHTKNGIHSESRFCMQSCRYSVGVTPVIFLNMWEKWEEDTNPASSPAREMLTSERDSSSLAASHRAWL